MPAEVKSNEGANWLASSSFAQIFRTFGLAVHPTKLMLALAALVLTMVWGAALDSLWTWKDHGVPVTAVWQYVGSGEASTVPEGTATTGIFDAWRRYESWCAQSAVASAARGNLWSGGLDVAMSMIGRQVGGGQQSSIPPVAPIGLIPCLISMGGGVIWMATQHVWYALLFLLGTLAIWALLGGAICRMAAVQFARDERIGWRDAVAFARQRYLSGFVLAPLLPVLMVLFAGLLLFLGGMFLRIPWLGDILGSLVFVLAIFGGGVIAAVTIGTIAGGSLFWPTIAAEGSESLDAVSRSFNYVGNTPWRTLFYGLVAMVYGSLCFLLARAFAYLTLAATHAFVGYGTAPFGWWLRDGVPKLDRLWSWPALGQLAPQSVETAGIESFSGAVIGLWVFLVLLLVWAFLASFYFCGSTVIYFLLRRDNDAMDLEDVFIDEYEEGDHAAAAPPPAAPPPSTAGVQLTVDGQPPEAAPAPAPPAAADPPDKDNDSDEPPADADKAE